jgi:hypothetical protein
VSGGSPEISRGSLEGFWVGSGLDLGDPELFWVESCTTLEDSAVMLYDFGGVQSVLGWVRVTHNRIPSGFPTR